MSRYTFAALALFAIATGLLAIPLQRAFHKITLEDRVARLVAKHQYAEGTTARVKIRSIHGTYSGGILHMNIDLLATSEFLDQGQAIVDAFVDEVAAEIDEPLVILVEAIPVDVVRLRSDSRGGSALQ